MQQPPGPGRRPLALLFFVFWPRVIFLLPIVGGFEGALGACEDSERWAEALAVLQGMRADGLLPNVFSHSSAISALEKSVRWVLSLHLLDQMEAQGVAPNEISYSGAVGACEKAASGPAARRSQTP